MCECFSYVGDGKQNTVAMIVGHHPQCPHFGIDNIPEFCDRLYQTVEMMADRKLAAELPKLRAEFAPKPKPEQKLVCEKTIQNKIYSWRFGGHNPIVPNAHLFCGENDIISVTKSGYIHEYEIKISKSDFKADFKKAEKHRLLSELFNWNTRKKYYNGDYYCYPNYFYYAAPAGLIDVAEIPAYAGLVEFGERPFPTETKKAPILHKNKISEKNLKSLFEKCFYRYWRLRLK